VEGVSALAALGASDWFNWLYLGIIQGFAQGFAIPMAQAFGAKDYASLRRNVGNAAILAAIMGAMITAISLISIKPVLSLMDTPAEIKPMSTLYLTILFSSFPLVMAYNLLAGILRSLGDGRSPLYAMIVAALTNIALDILFVAGFGWGVAGAAIATGIAQGCSALFCLLRLKKLAFIRPSREDLRLERRTCGNLMRLGLPVAAQNGTIGIGGMVVQSIANTMSVAFIAGYTSTNKLYGVLEIAAISYGYAMSTYAGQNLGARKADRIKKGVRSAALTGVITSLIIAGFMFAFGRSIVSSFISGTPAETAEAVGIACEYLYLMSGLLPVLYILHIYRSALQGMGNTVAPMISGIAELVMRVSGAWILPGLMGYSGLFWAEILAWAGADVILLSGYFKTFARIRRQLI